MHTPFTEQEIAGHVLPLLSAANEIPSPFPSTPIRYSISVYCQKSTSPLRRVLEVTATPLDKVLRHADTVTPAVESGPETRRILSVSCRRRAPLNKLDISYSQPPGRDFSRIAASPGW